MKNMLNASVEAEFVNHKRKEIKDKFSSNMSRVIFTREAEIDEHFVFSFSRNCVIDVYSVIDDGLTFVVRRPSFELMSEDDIDLTLIAELRAQTPTFVVTYNRDDVYSDDMRDILIKSI